MLHLCWKQYIRRIECLNIQCDNVSEFKSDRKKLLEKRNTDIQRTTTKNKRTYTAFVKAFSKEWGKQLFKTMDTQELQDPEKVSAIWVKNLSSIVNKMNNTKSLMIDMKPKDAIKLVIVELNKSETYSKENILPEDGLHRYLYQPGHQHKDKKILTLSGVKIHIGQIGL